MSEQTEIISPIYQISKFLYLVRHLQSGHDYLQSDLSSINWISIDDIKIGNLVNWFNVKWFVVSVFSYSCIYETEPFSGCVTGLAPVLSIAIHIGRKSEASEHSVLIFLWIQVHANKRLSNHDPWRNKWNP